MARAMWVPGSDHGLVWGGGVAILDGSVSIEVVEKTWLLLEGGADLRAFLEGMSEAIGSGLLGLPGFAIGLVRGEAMSLAARGEFSAGVVGAAGVVSIEGSGVTTWSERQVLGGEEITVGRVGTERARGRILVGGVVPAGVVVWHRRDAALTTDANVMRAAAPAASPPSGTGVGMPSAPVGADPASAATGSGDRAAAAAGSAAPPEPEDTVDPDREDAPGAGPGRFDALWGETVIHTVEEAAIRPPGETPARPEHADNVTLVESQSSGSGDGAVSPLPAAAVPEARRHKPPSSAGAAGSQERTDAGRARVPGDHDGATVARIDLDAGPPGGDIPASLCPEQHPNPPQAASCRICGRRVGSDIVSIPQPSIGRVHTSTGESADLAGPLIVGRNPRPARFQGSRIPGRLELPFPHISGSHLEFRVEGWSLLAVDLNSRNGTFLRRGEDPPQRLLANSPVALYGGDVIDFGDDVMLSFEFLA
ncbi:MAG: FHA domain-containing protein [Tetrasphaera sp.]|nr:FHA domain-containing protein [Tetrasphaera sp.]